MRPRTLLVMLMLGSLGTVGILNTPVQSSAGPWQADEPLLPIRFAHVDHGEVNCIDCHHEFADATGRGPCFECHKTDPSVAALIETQFHDLCRGCHVERQQAGLDGGPTRRCGDCHQEDDAP